MLTSQSDLDLVSKIGEITERSMKDIYFILCDVIVASLSHHLEHHALGDAK